MNLLIGLWANLKLGWIESKATEFMKNVSTFLPHNCAEVPHDALNIPMQVRSLSIELALSPRRHHHHLYIDHDDDLWWREKSLLSIVSNSAFLTRV